MTMKRITDNELIEKAKAVINPKTIGDFTSGDVGCALVTDRGNIYLGVCIDVSSGMGFCAEHAAIAAMVTGGEYKIEKIVAVWAGGSVIPPCGRCREFMWQIDKGNRNTEVIIAEGKSVKLEDLLPYHWQSGF